MKNIFGVIMVVFAIVSIIAPETEGYQKIIQQSEFKGMNQEFMEMKPLQIREQASLLSRLRRSPQEPPQMPPMPDPSNVPMPPM